MQQKHTNSLKPNLFLPQWEPYTGINLQKAFPVVLKINPPSLEAFVAAQGMYYCDIKSILQTFISKSHKISVAYG